MAIATKMASPAAISPANMVSLNGGKNVRFNTSKMNPVLLSNDFVSKFCSLNISSRETYMTRWNFAINPIVDSADEAELKKHAPGAAVHVFYAEKDKNVKKLAKSNSRPRISIKERNPKRLSSSASKRIELDYFQVLKYPLVTELAMREILQNNALVFVVDKHADKKNIKAAFEKISGVQTKKVNTLMMPDGNKKAYVMLRPNHSALEVAKKLRIV
ncbi:hypothetical protein M9H77_05651 [Catharanthus roseus]|uniref:Uncharacterized protein n=1 Tax=Catharanthus roseus TaxID=4058 RepID=A0ACC0CHZ4_CATRO|nr:hypothetical protein M9H77_05651 [Catharanthus roseus]